MAGTKQQIDEKIIRKAIAICEKNIDKFRRSGFVDGCGAASYNNYSWRGFILRKRELNGRSWYDLFYRGVEVLDSKKGARRLWELRVSREQEKNLKEIETWK